jgi:hypothetical protein
VKLKSGLTAFPPAQSAAVIGVRRIRSGGLQAPDGAATETHSSAKSLSDSSQVATSPLPPLRASRG